MNPVLNIINDVFAEMSRQDEKFGDQSHLPDGTGFEMDQRLLRIIREVSENNSKKGTHNWRDILAEEVYEACAETDPVLIRAELVQVVAVAIQWIGALDKRMEGLK